MLQPLDVSVNKPLKSYVTDLWMDYMYKNDAGKAKPPSKQQIVDWVVEAQSKISRELVAKSFKVTGLTTNLDGSEDHMINGNIAVNI